MKRSRALASLLAVVGLILTTGVVASQLPMSIIQRHDTSADLVPQPGPLEVVQLILDWPAGVATAPHYHSGTAHNTVLAGEITLRHAGSERRPSHKLHWRGEPRDPPVDAHHHLGEARRTRQPPQLVGIPERDLRRRAARMPPPTPAARRTSGLAPACRP